MIRNIKIFILTIFLLYGCEYEPIYSNKLGNNFSIEKINYNGEIGINNLINRKLERYKNIPISKKFSIKVNSFYEKISLSKDRTGKTTDYKIIIKIDFQIYHEEKIINLNLKEDFIIKNTTDEFEERKYEKTKIENATDIMTNALIIQLSQIQ
tara:strand:- start:690 stop:1148 length:459 start_codon:yes stop_codon:yes gene_type:complete